MNSFSMWVCFNQLEKEGKNIIRVQEDPKDSTVPEILFFGSEEELKEKLRSFLEETERTLKNLAFQ